VTVLLTGVTGFVGPYLVRALRGHGAAVYGMGSEREGPAELERWHVADLRDADSLAAAITSSRPAAIVHLAAQSSTARSFEAPAETFEINALGTWRLLEQVRRHAPQARVLVVGTGDVYGPQPEGSKVDESAPLRPVSPYALSKAAADAAAEAAHRHWGLDVVRVRAFGHAGPGQTPRFVVPAIAEQVARAEREGEPVIRVGNLDVVRDMLDVRDVVEAYRLVLDRGERGAVYNVCRGQGVCLTDVAGALLARARRPLRLEVDPARLRPADTPYLVGDPGRIESATGWRARIPFATTLEDVLEEARARLRSGLERS
jgi:GDP-4-dehydro-6-deoxy-D-mannose reductase